MRNPININCAVCNRKTKVKVVYNASFKGEDITPQMYVSRRIPDRIHFRIVKCLRCGLIFSNPIYNTKGIIASYKSADVPLMTDIQNSALVYIKYIKKILKRLPKNKKILDIGCGNGFFLSQTRSLGIKEAWGIEPSINSIKKIAKGINKQRIIVDVFDKKYFKKDFFNVITFFQVFDHLLDPNKFLKDCHFILKRGGYIVAIMHDVGALSHQIMGERSPIFDIQHIYLFNKSTIKKMFEKHGFIVESVSTVFTTYTLYYWIKMAPFPKIIKDAISTFESSFIFKKNITLPAGNMVVIARRK